MAQYANKKYLDAETKKYLDPKRKKTIISNIILIIISMGMAFTIWFLFIENSKVSKLNESKDPILDLNKDETITNPITEEKVTQNNIKDTENEFKIPESDKWMTVLVNKDNPLPSDYSPKLKYIEDGYQFDARAADQLTKMLTDARNSGLNPFICSAYRSVEEQTRLFNEQINIELQKGLPYEQAEIESEKSITAPGKSEHNLGLGVDIVSFNYQHLNDEQANTPEIKWLTEHCYKYGFIIRYPENKKDITKIIFEPWHFRYVGIKAAKEIKDKGLCLEEYVKISK